MQHRFDLSPSRYGYVGQRSPYEYARGEQVYFGFEVDDQLLPFVVDLIGEDHFMFASDIPHSDREYDAAGDLMKREDVGESAKRKLLAENAARSTICSVAAGYNAVAVDHPCKLLAVAGSRPANGLTAARPWGGGLRPARVAVGGWGDRGARGPRWTDCPPGAVGGPAAAQHSGEGKVCLARTYRGARRRAKPRARAARRGR